MTLASLGLLALLAQDPTADSLRALARTAPDDVLRAHVQAAPMAARQATADALRWDDTRIARRLAAAYAAARGDSFPLREVTRFAARPAPRQAAWRWADSVRREGIAAFGRDGAATALALWRRALARATTVPDTAQMAAIGGNVGRALLQLGSLAEAQRALARALALARAVGDRRVEANALTALGTLHDLRGERDVARTRLLQALALYDALGDTRGLAAGHNELGMLAWATGDLREARRQLESALLVNRREGRREIAATNLVNLAGVVSQDGDFSAARRYYDEALATWRARGATADAADALLGLGQLELRRGDYAAAREALQEAIATFERTGPPSSELAARRALAGALAAEGRLQETLDALRTADARAASAAADPAALAALALARADVTVQLGELAEAERLFDRAARLYAQAEDAAGEAEARHGRGLLLLERGDYAGAQRAFESALLVQRARGERRGAGLTYLAMGEAARAQGDTALARRRADQALVALQRAGDPVGEAAALGARASLAVAAGRPAAAETLFRRALARLSGHRAPEVEWRLEAGLAEALHARGDVTGAISALRRAIATVEDAGHSLVLPERRATFLGDKWELYGRLALLERARGEPAAAFAASERLRGREMLEMLQRGRVAIPVPGDDPTLGAREQDLRRLVAQLTEELEDDAPSALRGRSSRAASAEVREALLAAQADYAALLRELQERAPRHAALLPPPPAGWRAVADALAADEALVEYLVGDTVSLAFVVRPDSLAVIELGIGRRELARLVEFARSTLDAPRAPSDSLWLGAFRRLQAHLMTPLEESGALRGTARLVLVPHAELHYVPFAALVSERGALVDRYALATTPSATAWLALRRRATAAAGRGILAMAPRPLELPGSLQEVDALATYAREPVRDLRGSAATEAAFRRWAPASRVLHLATFGVLNRHNPLFSFVDLAPGDGGDGRLEVHEVFGLRLSADLVVLSACETALSSGRTADVPPGDDWVGLTRAFLHAGARDVVATLWAVDDAATSLLMTEFHRRYAAGAPADAALAAAQQVLRRRPGTTHPFHWAGMVLVR